LKSICGFSFFQVGVEFVSAFVAAKRFQNRDDEEGFAGNKEKSDLELQNIHMPRTEPESKGAAALFITHFLLFLTQPSWISH